MTETSRSDYHHRIGVLDGLRAIAIVAVLLFHFRLGNTHGGFVGVDVFFVISGFLMTRLVAADVAAGRFEFGHFMARRLMRVAPALFVTVIATVSFAYFIFLPAEFDALAKSATASVLFVANLHFSRVTPYFAETVAPSPLLHLWSLGLEMQFYLVLPFCLVAARRLRLSLFPTILIGALFGLALFLTAASIRPVATFFLPPTRAWEFMAGGVLALAPYSPLSRRLAETVSVAGLIAIVGAVVAPSRATEFQVWPVVAAVCGTSAIIWSARVPETTVHRLLSLSAFRAIGLISYSTYLVHWPILVLAEYWHIVPLEMGTRIALLLGSIALGALGWRCVEEPFRRAAVIRRRPNVTVMSVVGGACVLAAVAWNAPIAVSASNRTIEATIQPERLRWAGPARQACLSDETASPVPPERSCVIGSAAPPKTVVWADSHGGQLSYSLAKALIKTGESVSIMTSSGCPPLIGYRSTLVTQCMARNQAVLRHLQSHPQLSTIVLTMRYEGYPGLTEGDIARGLAATIATLPDRRFVIVGPWPKPKFDVPNGLVRLQLSDRWHVKPFLPRAHHIADRAGVWRAIGSLTDNPRVRAIDPAPSVCFGARCPYILDGQLLYFDDNHPSFVATDRVAARLAATFPR